MMEEIRANKVILALTLAREDVKRIFGRKHKDMIEEVSVCAK